MLRGADGATAVEYAMLASFIGAAVVATVFLIGGRLVEMIEPVIPALQP